MNAFLEFTTEEIRDADKTNNLRNVLDKMKGQLAEKEAQIMALRESLRIREVQQGPRQEVLVWKDTPVP